jgi:multisubunit Na+/H+ antiporter MnhC subunit
MEAPDAMVLFALLIGWTLVALAIVVLCVAARRGDEGDRTRRDAAPALRRVAARRSA